MALKPKFYSIWARRTRFFESLELALQNGMGVDLIENGIAEKYGRHPRFTALVAPDDFETYETPPDPDAEKSEFGIIYGAFMDFMQTYRTYATPNESTISQYEGFFKDPKDEEDVIVSIWKKFGFCTYKNGLFTLLDPTEYNGIARRFPEVSDKAEVFARTATGCLFLWEEYSFGRNIAFLNIHTGQKNIIGTSFNVLFEWSLTDESYWTDDCNGQNEFAAVSKFGQIPVDKCAGYSLALAFGGNEGADNMALFDHKAHLEVLSQLLQ